MGKQARRLKRHLYVALKENKMKSNTSFLIEILDYRHLSDIIGVIENKTFALRYSL